MNNVVETPSVKSLIQQYEALSQSADNQNPSRITKAESTQATLSTAQASSPLAPPAHSNSGGFAPTAPPPPPPIVNNYSTQATESRPLQRGAKPSSTMQVPKFPKAFPSSSIGIENELTGLVVAMPKSATQAFGFVQDKQGNPLFMLTKDMDQGAYTNPKNAGEIKPDHIWQTYTVELVSYPSAMNDKEAVQARKDAMLWLANIFTSHIGGSTNHSGMSNIEDDRFSLNITQKHLIAAGNGIALEGNGSTIGMTPSGQQATVAVRANAFGSSESKEMQLLEKAPWYKSELKEELLIKEGASELKDPETASKVYAYTTSIFSNTARLAKEFGIPIGDWDPKTENIQSNARGGLTDPKVKNAWEILPRTKTSLMFDLLEQSDRSFVKNALKEAMAANPNISKTLGNAVNQYLFNGGAVAGHGIDEAKIDNQQAILFEFRTIPDALSEYLPKSEVKVQLDAQPLDEFKNDRGLLNKVKKELNQFLETHKQELYDAYKADKENSGAMMPASFKVDNILSKVPENFKAGWVSNQHPQEWEALKLRVVK